MYLRITFIGSTILDATGRRLRPPIFSGYNLREAPTPQFSGHNQKEATTPYVHWLQPEGGYNHISFPCTVALKYKCQMMKPLPHYHYEIYHCKHVPSNCNQPVPVLILYQQNPTGK
jgi:hypothetical protein